jgi:hypothetical protein
MKTPASTSCCREKKYIPRASMATAHKSQLMVPASTMPGARATMAASHGRRLAIRAVARTVTRVTAATSVTLMSK